MSRYFNPNFKPYNSKWGLAKRANKNTNTGSPWGRTGKAAKAVRGGGKRRPAAVYIMPVM